MCTTHSHNSHWLTFHFYIGRYARFYFVVHTLARERERECDCLFSSVQILIWFCRFILFSFGRFIVCYCNSDSCCLLLFRRSIQSRQTEHKRENHILYYSVERYAKSPNIVNLVNLFSVVCVLVCVRERETVCFGFHPCVNGVEYNRFGWLAKHSKNSLLCEITATCRCLLFCLVLFWLSPTLSPLSLIHTHTQYREREGGGEKGQSNS